MHKSILQKYFSPVLYTILLASVFIINARNIVIKFEGNDGWQKLNSYYIRDIIEFKGEVIFCANEGIFSLKDKLNSKSAYCLDTDNTILVAGTNEGLLVFDSSWKKIEIIQDGYPAQVRSIKNYNKIFYFGHAEGSYGITTWQPETGILFQDDFEAYIRSIEVFDSKILAGDEDGNIWISKDSGRSFDSTIYLNDEHLTVRTIKWIDETLHIGAGWMYINFDQTEHYLTPTDFESGFVATGDLGILKYENNGLVPFNDGLTDLRTSAILIHNDVIYCGTVSGLYKRTLK